MADRKMKRWFFLTLFGSVGLLALIAAVMIFVDPYFHYHKPIPGITYRLFSERYMNRGIAKYFEYDAVITGSSMNQNFKATQMDELFQTNTIKIPFSGAGFQEVANNIEVALTSGNEVKYVLWGLDYNGILRESYYKGYDDYPEFLYDENYWNDVSYFWNKTLLFEGLISNLLLTLQQEESTTFDEYTSWEVGGGWEQISKTYRRSEEILPMKRLNEVEEVESWKVEENIGKNVVDLAKKYPDTQFLIFYTPYSALYWESLYRDGNLVRQLEAEAIATKALLSCDNIKLYSFARETEVTGNPENYRDKEHYVAAINDSILEWIKEDRGLITKDNYQELLQWEYDYYMNYDYDRLYEGYEEYMN